jgi:transposase-like protein
VRRGREFWQELVSEVESGAAIADVARHHRVQPRTLSWWKWRLRTQGQSPMLLPVVVRRPRIESSAAIELCVRDVSIRVSSDTDIAYIAALVDALRS